MWFAEYKYQEENTVSFKTTAQGPQSTGHSPAEEDVAPGFPWTLQQPPDPPSTALSTPGANLVGGFYQRMERMHKYAFGQMLICMPLAAPPPRAWGSFLRP